MTRKLMTIACLFAALAVPAAAQTVEEILAKNLEARGGEEQIASLDSVRMSGKAEAGQGMEAPFTVLWKRPNQVRLEVELQGMTLVQAFDGETGWQIVPFTGNPKPEEIPTDQRKQIVELADSVEGPLINAEAKGNKVELVGEKEVDGTPAYELKVTLKDGDVSHIFLDKEYFLEIKTTGKRNFRGQEIEFENIVGDYKEVGGVLFPFSLQSMTAGAPAAQSFTFDEIEVNVDVPEDAFTMPEVEEATEPKDDSAG